MNRHGSTGVRGHGGMDLRMGCVAAALLLALGAAAGPEPAASKQPERNEAMDHLRTVIKNQAVDVAQPGWRTRLPKFPSLKFDEGRDYYVGFVTGKGAIKLRLFTDTAPEHAANFLYLADLGFFDGLSFHRVIPGFMAQGGCPLGTGTGGPGYRFAGEFKGSRKHDRPGLLSMANAGPDTDGSQFFITFAPAPWLDGKHTLFGEVVEGRGTLAALERCGSIDGKTTERLVIEKAAASAAPRTPASGAKP